MPFDLPGGGPMNPSGKRSQGSTFNEQPIEDVNTGERNSLFGDAANMFEENEAAKKPFPIKPLLFAAIGLIVLTAVVIILYQVFSSGGDQRGVGEMLEDPPAVDLGDGWESAEGEEDEPITDPLPIITHFTAEQLSELRAYGYTGDEIEQFQSEGTDFQNLVDNALALQAAQHIKIYNYLLKNSLASADEAYTAALSMSWLGLPIPDVEPGEYDALGNPMSEYYSEQK